MLERIVVAIVALIGGREGEGGIARRVRSAALALLRPAESAARRLIVIAARGLAVAPAAPRPAPAGLRRGAGGRRIAFRLFDPPLRLQQMRLVAAPRGTPRIRSFWSAPIIASPIVAPPPPALRPDPDQPVPVGRLRLRLAALEAALADLPRQARRLARLRARRQAAFPAPPRSPLRLGRPPGWRKRPEREVDRLLRECNLLAHDALRSDTS